MKLQLFISGLNAGAALLNAAIVLYRLGADSWSGGNWLNLACVFLSAGVAAWVYSWKDPGLPEVLRERRPT